MIHDFTAEEGSPRSLAADNSGNLYGTSPLGGNHGDGMVYKLSQRNQDWLFTPLYSFTGDYEGTHPGKLIVGPEGAPYGTSFGGLPNGNDGWGLVYRLRPPRTLARAALCDWTKEVLYRFMGGTDGGIPSSIVFDQQGHLYGTTSFGGAYGAGVVFELTPSNGGWTENVIYDFPGGFSGVRPDSLLAGTDGMLYGLTVGGVGRCGFYGGYPCGIVFQLVHNNNGWTENVLYFFQGTDRDGGLPGSLVQDGLGNLHGISTWYFEYIWTHLSAAIEFKLSPENGNWVFTSTTRHSESGIATFTPASSPTGSGEYFRSRNRTSLRPVLRFRFR